MTEDKSIKLVVKIFQLDVESRSGRLRMIDGGPEGELPFSIVGKQSLHRFVLAFESQRSTITALREVVVHPTGAVTVTAYHILEIAR